MIWKFTLYRTPNSATFTPFPGGIAKQLVLVRDTRRAKGDGGIGCKPTTVNAVLPLIACLKLPLRIPRKYFLDCYGQDIITAVEYPSLFWTRTYPEEGDLQVFSSVSVSDRLMVLTTKLSRFPLEHTVASIRYPSCNAGAAAFQWMVTLLNIHVKTPHNSTEFHARRGN